MNYVTNTKQKSKRGVLMKNIAENVPSVSTFFNIVSNVPSP